MSSVQVWLLRHGDAVPHGSKPDFQRELTEKGERQARNAGAAMERLGARPAACYTSPKVRARDTARLACEPFGCEVIEADSVAGGFDRDDLRELQAAHRGDACIVVVGHEPDFSQVVHDVTGARVDFKKGGVAVLDGSHLVALLRPGELAHIAAARG